MKKLALLFATILMSALLTACSSDPMPDVVGKTCEEAIAEIQDFNSAASIKFQNKDGEEIPNYEAKYVNKGWEVVSQSPEAGNTDWMYKDIVLTIFDSAAEERQKERDAQKEKDEQERQAILEKNKAEEADKIAKWGEDYLRESTAIAAVELYGEKQYPFGFKLNSIGGKIAETQEEDGSWTIKYTCDVTNEYGTTEKNLNCEAQVSGSDSNPVVTYFQVY